MTVLNSSATCASTRVLISLSLSSALFVICIARSVTELSSIYLILWPVKMAQQKWRASGTSKINEGSVSCYLLLEMCPWPRAKMKLRKVTGLRWCWDRFAVFSARCSYWITAFRQIVNWRGLGACMNDLANNWPSIAGRICWTTFENHSTFASNCCRYLVRYCFRRSIESMQWCRHITTSSQMIKRDFSSLRDS